jgi:TfoX/Sxy family transcriptional regulator of competence genes
MVFDQGLTQRIRETIGERPDLVEKKMFGGIGFMLRGNMACGVNKDDLIVRVGPQGYEASLAQPHTRPFDFTGRPMKGWIMVGRDGYEADEDLEKWVQKGVDFALSLPTK